MHGAGGVAAKRGALDQRSDPFALGVVAYYALTGKHAFPARSTEELPDYWRRGPGRTHAAVG